MVAKNETRLITGSSDSELRVWTISKNDKKQVQCVEVLCLKNHNNSNLLLLDLVSFLISCHPKDEFYLSIFLPIHFSFDKFVLENQFFRSLWNLKVIREKKLRPTWMAKMKMDTQKMLNQYVLSSFVLFLTSRTEI